MILRAFSRLGHKFSTLKPQTKKAIILYVPLTIALGINMISTTRFKDPLIQREVAR